MPRNARLFAALAVLSLLLGGLAWGTIGRSAESAPPPTARVARADLSTSVLATGAIEAAQLVSVGARISGQIETLAVGLGDRVQEGELIAEIDSADQKNAVLQAKANLAQIEAQIAAQEATIHEQELLVGRRTTLNAKNLTSSEDLQSAQAALAVAQADRAALVASRAQAEISVATAQTELDRTRITAPITGTVVAVVNKAGATVNANTSSPTIVKLAALDRMVVKAEISEADIVNVKPGLPARFTLSGAPDLAFDATLRAIEPAPAAIADADTIETGTAIYYNALLDVDNPEGVLRIGMTAEVTIDLASQRGVLSVPTSALGATAPDGRRTVQVWNAERGTTETRQVRVGLDTGVLAEITEGLAEGERVVTAATATATGTASGNKSSSGSRRMGGPPPMGF
ncbi:efflux RND transporter periplasmic adaptor subunit [Frigidibacter sp. MR17.14]|uniref:efflux RND transporter periplasmic adaptor subunit n=1 Tax=Frigidibacter sp. MR17.14 TaxID=3126509 RepID=UPI003012B8E2